MEAARKPLVLGRELIALPTARLDLWVGIEDDAVEKDARDDPRFQQTAEELEEQGIEDFQLHYALQTLRRTSPMNIAARAK